MKLEEGIKLKPQKGRRVEIPNCSRDDLPEFFINQGFKKGIEIGTYQGKFTEHFAKAGLEIYTVDPYKQYRDYHGGRVGYPERCEQIYKEAQKRLNKYPNCKILRKTSMQALDDFEDHSLDFVYIDGNHGVKYVMEDIYEWSFKVKIGGIISGHDYAIGKATKISLNVLEVRHAVDAFAAAKRIETLYVLGERHAKEGEHRDEWRSWMWFNPDIRI